MPLAYEDHRSDQGGEGLPLVLLHAFPLERSTWDRLVPLLPGGCRVVAVDLPGLGESDVPTDEPSMAAVAADVLALLDHLGIDRAVVFGVSTGGYVALELARTAPERLAALVLGSTTTRLVAPDDPAERRRTAQQVERSGSTEAVAGSADEGLGATAHREQPELVTRLRDVIAAARPAGVAWMARAIASRVDTSAALAACAGPVLLLFGAEDEATPPARGEEMLALRDPDRTALVVLPRTGHLTALEQPDQVAGHLVELLGRAGR